MDSLGARRSAIDKVLSSNAFQKAPSERRLLQLLAEVAINESAVQLNQAEIARRLFGDHNRAGRVGVTAARLRRRLEAYNRVGGALNEIAVRLPERSYQLMFEPRANPESEGRVREEIRGPVPLREYKELLKDLSRVQATEGELNTRIKAWVESSARYSTVFDPVSNSLPERHAFEAFFSAIAALNADQQLSLSDMRSLARQLGLHPVLIDHICSQRVEKACLLLQLAGRNAQPIADSAHCAFGQFRIVGHGEKHYGTGAQYHVPSVRLAMSQPGTNIAFVHLVLEAGGRSDAHRHGGEEVIFLLQGGPIEVRLESGGERFHLEIGSYIHFYAEQSHSVRNPLTSEPAELIVLRFSQHRHKSDQRDPLSREEIQEHLADWLAHGGQLAAFAKRWVLEAAGLVHKLVDPFGAGRDVPDQVLNGLGLARFLRRLPQSTSHIAKLEKVVSDIVAGRERVSVKDLERHCEYFSISYRPILYEFVFPAASRLVVVSRASSESDWVSLDDFPRDFVQKLVAHGVIHEIPKRSLLCSDVALTWLTLEPGKVTAPADHPGSELLVPIEGEATIEVKVSGHNVWQTISNVTALTHIAYFDSTQIHRVCNFTDQTVSMLVVRFYACCPTCAGNSLA